MYEDLREKEKNVLEFLKISSDKNGYPPSVREICKALEIRSTSTVFKILKTLEEHHYIKKDASKTRAIVILDDIHSNTSDIPVNEEVLSLPLVGNISAGQPVLAEENIEEYIPLPSSYVKGKNCFMLRVKGDSMIEAGIMNRDFIIVDSSATSPSNGDKVVALIDNESSTVKTFLKKDGKIILRPENSDYEDMVFEPSEVKILGTVTGLFRVL